MKYFLLVVCIFLIQFSVFPQQPKTILSQLFLGIEGVESGEQVTHYISAEGAVWELQQGGSFVITTDPRVYNNSDISIGNYYPHPDFLADFNWIWKSTGNEPVWGLGLYKITNSKEPYVYFYLDARDYNYGNTITNPDIWFYNDLNGYFKFAYPGNLSINIWELVRVSDLLEFTYTTSGLQNFWSNALVCISSDPEYNYVRLIWGKHPSFNCTGYKVYRSYQITPVIKYRVIATVNSNTFEYIDEETPYYGTEPVYYYVKGYNGTSYSEPSNIVSTPISKGFGKEVININKGNYEFALYQNSPNPFNPSTEISYQISDREHVTLKVYDMLGNEITTLVDEFREAGKYIVKLEEQNLVSGVYFYTLTSGKYLATKKMLLIR